MQICSHTLYACFIGGDSQLPNKLCCREYVIARGEFEAASLEDATTAFPTLAVWIREAVQGMGRRHEVMVDVDMRKLSVPPKHVCKYIPVWKHTGAISDAMMEHQTGW